MAFTFDEKVRIRHTLGYPNVGAVASFAMGVPAAFQTIFQLESALTKVLPEAEGKARELLVRCETIEQQIFDDAELLVVNEVGSIKIREDEMAALWKQYDMWRNALANIFAVPPHPFDFRFNNPAVGGINVKFNH